MKNNRTNETLVCELTDTERREHGIALATTLGDMESLEAEKKSTADHYKDRLAGMQARADDLSRKVRDGKEWRDVECIVEFGQPDREHKQIIRLDTGETVRTLRMTAEELQFKLPLDSDDEDGPTGNPMDSLKAAMSPGDTLEVFMGDEVVYQAGGEDEREGPEIVDEEPAAPPPAKRGRKAKVEPEAAEADY